MRKVFIAIAIVVVVLVIIAVVLPFFVNANQFRPRIEAEASKALGRQVQVGNLTLSIFSGGVTAENLSVAENPAFGKEPFLTAKSMNIGVEMMPLITSRKLNIQAFTINQPSVNLVRDLNGKWNVSTLGTNAPKSQSSGPGEFNVGKFAINGGTVTVRYEGTRTKPAVYSNVDLTATDLSLTSAFPYQFSATPPGGGSVNVKGTFGPLSQAEAGQTPLTAAIKVNKFDLGSSGLVEPASDIRGIVNLDANLDSNGKTAKLDGTAHADQLCLVHGCSPSNTPVAVNFGADYNLLRQTGALTKGVVKAGSSAANLGGTFDMSGATTRLNMNLDAKNMAVGDIKGLLPAVGVILPSGANLQGGTADAHANITGPTDALVTTGAVNVNNTKLTGYDLGSKLAAISKLAGIRSAQETAIQLFNSDVRVAPEGTQVNNLKLVLPEIGTLTGQGVIGPKNELNFKMIAQLNTQGNALGALTQAVGYSGKNATIPFRVSGTTASPVFTPDVGGAVGGLLSGAKGQQQKPNAQDLINNLGGLFGKKKKP